MLSGEQINKLLAAVISTLDEGIVDGVIWALNLDALGLKFPDFVSLNGKTIDVKQKLAEYNEKLLISAKIPQYSLLKTNQVKLLMTHGGMETLHESFFTGTPTLILPFVADQPYNAKRVQTLEIGDSLILDEVDSYQLVKKVKSIINNDKITLNTKKIQLLARSNSKKIKYAGELIKTYANYNKLCSQTKGWRDFICELEPYLLQQPTLTKSQLTPKHYFGLIAVMNVVIVLALTYAFLFPFIKRYTKEKTN
ncbi:glycosyltransferase family 1 protein [Conidiobolus coronatus NRRL 28638]|uniref:Glycosyltransferase family 1 protein n=1 Tax=Conidiobolus coronatus (strain ATCC 28846 / CBS 209.66 / NRRL 28638) TaxID=796925 RepID=A0A137P8N1_CONC2|nr:glycosyltransferase family 1 protein [Conidiobolus coronatus NRRL 28638]|eukprot:KXN71367.1 glycosyltransferase family 1 protein [Conidiobolus coronatus NRRL 28638]